MATWPSFPNGCKTDLAKSLLHFTSEWLSLESSSAAELASNIKLGGYISSSELSQLLHTSLKLMADVHLCAQSNANTHHIADHY